MSPRAILGLAALAAAAALGVACGQGPSPAAMAEDDAGGTPAPGATGDDGDDGGSSLGSPSSPDAGSPSDAAAAGVRPEKTNQGNSAGCGKTGGTGLQSRTMTVAGVQRSYLRFIPTTYVKTTPLALVLGLHGSGGTAAGTRTTFDLESHANGKAIFLYPQALPSKDPAFLGEARWDTTMGSDDYAFVDAILAEIENDHCVDLDRVFVAGFSLGARFTSMLGCYRGDTLRAIAPVAPGMDAMSLPLAKGPCSGEVGLWTGVGDDDPDHQPGAMLVRDYYATANGCSSTRTPTTPTGCEAYQGCRAEVPATWCTYPGPHMWPSIAPAGVWNFFASFH